MSEPKPTGEWTVDSLKEMINEAKGYGAEWHEIIADAHNAALAAKATELHDEWWERVQDANKQLAAEREEVKRLITDKAMLYEANQQLREQLAAAQATIKEITGELAERTAHDCDFHAIDASEWWKAVKRARKLDTTAFDAAIAAAQRPLVDSLKRADGAIRSGDHVKMGLALVVIRDRLALLAKVKEGK